MIDWIISEQKGRNPANCEGGAGLAAGDDFTEEF